MDDDKESQSQPEPTNQPEPTEVTTDAPDEQAPVEESKESEEQTSEPSKSQSPDFTPPKKKKNKKKLLLWLLVILLLLGGGAAAYWYKFMKSSDTPSSGSNQQQQTEETSEQEEAVKTYTPNTVSYAFKAKDSDPFSIYWRLVTGGERTEVKKLGSTDYISYSDVSGANVAFALDKDIYVSTDSGKAFTKVYTGAPGAQITSLKFSSEGDRLAFGLLPKAGSKNTAKSVDLKGQDEKDLFTSTKAGVFILGWSESKQKIIYREGCYNCDGAAELPVIRDLKTDKSSTVISGLTEYELANVAVSNDLSTLVFIKSTENAAAPSELGSFTGAPYTISTVDLSNNKATEVATVGTKGEKNANGTYKTRVTNVGFLAGTATAYYSVDNKLYSVKNGTGSLIYQASKDLLYVLYVSDANIISGSGSDTSDYILSNYTISTKKSVTIFSGDNNTVIFGVTTK